MSQDTAKRRYGKLSLDWFEGGEPGDFGWIGPACNPPLPPHHLAALLRAVADTIEENARESGSWIDQAAPHGPESQ